MDKIKNISTNALSRRTFLAGAGTAAATLAIGCNDSTAPTAAPTPPAAAPTAPTFNDIDILNFALNLEYLEAEFYLRAATGSGIPAADAGGTAAGAVTGGAMVPNLTPAQQQYVNIIAQDEYNHVKFLRSALGAMAVPRPAIDLTNSFNALATLATKGAANATTTFNPFATFNTFLIGGYIFEDVGVTAYHGAAGALSAKSPYLTPSAQILAVEGYHAAILRTLIVGTSLPAMATPLVAGDQTYITLARQVAVVRAALGGGGELLLSNGLTFTAAVPASGSTPAVPATETTGSSSIVNADANAIAFARTFDQVLHIVYGSATGPTGYGYGLASGGFFPAGVNGNIKQTYS